MSGQSFDQFDGEDLSLIGVFGNWKDFEARMTHRFGF